MKFVVKRVKFDMFLGGGIIKRLRGEKAKRLRG
jgi:hypothetical protein